MHRPGPLVAVDGAELGHPHRQLAVRAHPGVVDHDVPGAVHRLGEQLFLFRGLDPEHVVPVVVVVPGGLEELVPVHVRRRHEDVVPPVQLLAEELLDLAPDDRAARVPEDQPGAGLLVDRDQVEVLAEAAVVPLLGLFEPRQMRLELGLGGEGGAVDPPERLVLLAPEPVGRGDREQLEGADLGRVREVRAEAEVAELALLVVRGDRAALLAHEVELVRLLLFGEEAQRLLLGNVAADDRQGAGDDLPHPLFDLRQVLVRERGLAAEVVVEAFFRGRPLGDLRLGEELLDRLGHQVARAVAVDVQRVRILGEDQREVAIRRKGAVQVGRLAVDPHGQRVGEAGKRGAPGDVLGGDAGGGFDDPAVGKRDVDLIRHNASENTTIPARRRSRLRRSDAAGTGGGRRGRFRTADLYRVKVALSH